LHPHQVEDSEEALPQAALLGNVSVMTESKRDFWNKHPGLVWSNPDANDSAYIRSGLVQPRFGRLIEIAVEFGLERVRQEWTVLRLEDTPEVARAAPAVERILNNIEKGFSRVASSH
jgi:hypothetical protein